MTQCWIEVTTAALLVIAIAGLVTHHASAAHEIAQARRETSKFRSRGVIG